MEVAERLPAERRRVGVLTPLRGRRYALPSAWDCARIPPTEPHPGPGRRGPEGASLRQGDGREPGPALSRPAPPAKPPTTWSHCRTPAAEPSSAAWQPPSTPRRLHPRTLSTWCRSSRPRSPGASSFRPREVARIRVGALLHDVGKIGVPDAILTKEGSLSPEEWAMHPPASRLGKQIMEQAPELMDVVPLVLHHQEHYDGSGYPAICAARASPWAHASSRRPTPTTPSVSDRPYRSGRTTRRPRGNSHAAAGGSSTPKWSKPCGGTPRAMATYARCCPATMSDPRRAAPTCPSPPS